MNKYTIQDIIIGLDKSIRFDNDGNVIGYFAEDMVPEHGNLIRAKNKMIEEGRFNQETFEQWMFNYGENGDLPEEE